MNKIVVSVIIPAYNSGKTLRMAVDSALAQDVPLEVLVIDDASGKPVKETLAERIPDERIRIFRNDCNRGVAYSRNLGVKMARGKYVAFLDADDWWAGGKLAAQLEVMRREKVVLSCTGRELIREDGTSTGRRIPVRKNITYRSLLSHNMINCSSAVIRTDVAREFPMEHDDAHEDYILWLKILRKYKRAAGLPEPYLKYRMMGHSKSGTKLKSARMTYRVYRYMGYNPVVSACFFTSYAVHGVMKYYLRRKKH